MKTWGRREGGKIVAATSPRISAQCIRVPASDGHMAAVFVRFEKKPTSEQIIHLWTTATGKPQKLKLPSAPVPYLNYFTQDDRPQTRLDRDASNGISIGRLRADAIYDYKFVCLSHNTIRAQPVGRC